MDTRQMLVSFYTTFGEVYSFIFCIRDGGEGRDGGSCWGVVLSPETVLNQVTRRVPDLFRPELSTFPR